jgi:signal transduction histidine kinase
MHRTGGDGGHMRTMGRDTLDHELRASLSGIEAVAAALVDRRDRLCTGEVDELMSAIVSEARRLRGLLVPGHRQITSFRLAEVVKPAIWMTRCRGVVVNDAVPDDMWVRGHRDGTAEAVLTLLDNARIHAAPSSVDIWANVGDEMTSLYVEDRGPGPRDAGCQSTPTPREQPGNSGLGLRIARRLMEDQAGSLVVGARPDGGTTCELKLPTAPPPSSIPQSSMPQLVPHLPIVILR